MAFHYGNPFRRYSIKEIEEYAGQKKDKFTDIKFRRDKKGSVIMSDYLWIPEVCKKLKMSLSMFRKLFMTKPTKIPFIIFWFGDDIKRESGVIAFHKKTIKNINKYV